MALSIRTEKVKDRDTVEPSPLIDPDTGYTTQPVGQSGYSLIMSEEFNGTMTVTDAPNGLVTFRSGGPEWATWYPNWSMFTSQSPGGNHTNTDYESYYATSKVSLDGAGGLLLKCDKETTVAGLDYTAGMIQSLGFCTPTYGYFECKLKIQTASVNGHWPAFWMSSSAVNTWPPEIDIFEYFWLGTQFSQNSYIVGSNVALTTNAPSALTNYHVFGCKWTGSAVTWYVDGTQTNQTTSIVPQSAQYVLLNNGARTPASPTFSSNDVTVDYVRVWQ